MLHELRRWNGYVWSFLLLVATGAMATTHNDKAAFTLLAVALVNAGLATSLHRRIGRLNSKLEELLPIGKPVAAKKHSSSLLERTLNHLALQLVAVTIVSELMVIVIALAAGLGWQIAVAYGGAVIVALVPTGLIAEITIITRSAPSKQMSRNLDRVMRCALTDAAALLLVTGLSLLGTALFHIPPALTIIQFLIFACLLQLLPLVALGWDTVASKTDGSGGYLHFGLFGAVITYGNYLLFFARHSLSPQYLDVHNPLYRQAAAVALTTLLVCQFLNLLFARRPNPARFTRRFWRLTPQLQKALGLRLACLLVILYLPLSHTYFSTDNLRLTDWLSILLAALLYLGLRLAQHHSSKHSRKAVLQLHRQIHHS